VHSGGGSGGGFCLQRFHSLRFSSGWGGCLGGGRIVCKSAQLPSASSATAVMREDRIDKLVDRVETTSVVQDWEEEKEMRMVMKELVDLIVPEALAWASLNGLVVGDKSIKVMHAITCSFPPSSLGYYRLILELRLFCSSNDPLPSILFLWVRCFAHGWKMRQLVVNLGVLCEF